MFGESTIDVHINKKKHYRIGIFLQNQTDQVTIVSKQNHIDYLFVGDCITHVNGKRFRNAKDVAKKIWNSDEIILRIKRNEFRVSLLELN